MNKHFQYQESLKRLEKEVGLIFEGLSDFCDEDKAHLHEFGDKVDNETRKMLRDAYDLYGGEVCNALLKVMDLFNQERNAMEGQQSLEMAVA